jgi:hypothetical protein
MSTRGPTILNHTKSERWQGKPKNKYVRKTNIDILQGEKIMLSTTFSLYPRVEILKIE